MPESQISRPSPSPPGDVQLHGEVRVVQAQCSQVIGGSQDTRASQVQPAPLLHLQSSIDFGASRVGRKFKACRTCRKHKLKCERNGNVICQRCLDNGTECVFDTLSSRRRETATNRDGAFPNPNSSSAPQNHSAEPVTPNQQTARPDYHGLPTNAVHASHQTRLAGPGQLSLSVQSSPAEGSIYQLTPKTQPSKLTSKDLTAPVSAMHNMSHYDESVQGLSKTPSDTYYVAPRLDLFFGGDDCQTDLISRGLVEQRQARYLFNGFMSCATNFLPIFDPILDSFEALRAKEPFCFAVILFLASCVEASPISHQCAQRVKELMAASLFSYPASLGKVQGMILLVAYAEGTWFAIGHALQMALDLGLDNTLSHEHMPDHISNLTHSESQRQAVRSTRVWLALCFIEKEIAMGTAKLSRISKVLDHDLAHLTCQSHTHPPNMRLASLVEAVQIREEFMMSITSAKDLDVSGSQRLRDMGVRFDEWFEHWDALHKGWLNAPPTNSYWKTEKRGIDCGYSLSSFQRTSLRGQNRYAMIFLGCATIGRVSGSKRLSAAMKTSGLLPEMLRFVLAIAMDQLRLVVESESYKWYLKWATNYTIMSLTFTGIHQEDIDEREVYTVVSAVAQILTEYHDSFFHRLIQVRLAQHPGGSPNQMASHELGGGGNRSFGFDCPVVSNLDQQRTDGRDTDGSQHQIPLGDMGNEMMASTGMGHQGFNPPDSLDQFLETPDWMMNPSTMMVFDMAR
ncbi:hypothetical protein EDB81DRAFT_887092 [Dactylonectria macrodidyma]|uniref:Zn(2)-C6 fungal-type domain-containing protein n=1 Tax=Dactylonectria macrodidyma TaxID=307937 RepID=A0A9P9IX72_9HYPO|nr:hypothetical protein EDB81DRAFT_887092 [Dactylonectria macrodidyma]